MRYQKTVRQVAISFIGCLTSGVVPLMASNAFALDAAGGTEDRDSAANAQLEEVVVTARKRSENLQNVPASILAVSQAAIESLNAKSLKDLNGVTPNVSIEQNGNGTITIRGISSNARNIGFEAARRYTSTVFTRGVPWETTSTWWT